MTNKEIYDVFRQRYPEVGVSDYRPADSAFVANLRGITIWTHRGDTILFFPKHTKKLSGCPFCGGESKIIWNRTADYLGDFPVISCTNGCCEMVLQELENNVSMSLAEKEEYAIDKWNRRAEDATKGKDPG